MQSFTLRFEGGVARNADAVRAGSDHPVTLRVPPLLGQEGKVLLLLASHEVRCRVRLAVRAGSDHPVALRVPPLLGQEGKVLLLLASHEVR
jgi:hypothetical protein